MIAQEFVIATAFVSQSATSRFQGMSGSSLVLASSRLLKSWTEVSNSMSHKRSNVTLMAGAAQRIVGKPFLAWLRYRGCW